MDAYFDAKMRLFAEVVEEGGTAVIWADDARSDEVAAVARGRGLRVMTVGTRGEDIRLVEHGHTPLGQTLKVQIRSGTEHIVNLPMIGAYQAANALVAAGLVIATGGDAAETLREATVTMIESGQTDRLAGAMPYLNAFARVLGAHYHLIAARKGDEARKRLASIFVTRVLPRNAGDLAEARAGWADLDALPDAAFAGAA